MLASLKALETSQFQYVSYFHLIRFLYFVIWLVIKILTRIPLAWVYSGKSELLMTKYIPPDAIFVTFYFQFPYPMLSLDIMKIIRFCVCGWRHNNILVLNDYLFIQFQNFHYLCGIKGVRSYPCMPKPLK